MLEKVLKEIESRLFQLVGQIDYGEISDIDTYWASLAESLGMLSRFGYSCPPSPFALSDALRPFVKIIDDDLLELAGKMESFCEGGGSTDSIDEGEIEALQDNAFVFEKKFLLFTEKIRNIHGQ